MTSDSALVQQAYDLWSRNYDTEDNSTRDLDLAVTKSLVNQFSGLDVLEIGCGTGKNTEVISGVAKSVQALDLSKGMLAQARERVSLPSVHFTQANLLEQWPVADSSIDFVLGNLVLEHVQDLHFIFTEAHRALRPGGRMLVCELHPTKQILGAKAHFIEFDTGEGIQPPVYYHGVSEYVNSAIASGLAVERIDEWYDEPAESGGVPSKAPRLLSLQYRRIP
ncbi:putative S-adenosylmethionine-dependent methyltransferase [compost metagenome]